MNRVITLAGILCALAACQSNTPAPSARPAASSEPAFDVLITGGRVFDGTGAPWFRADVGIFGDRIGEIGQLADRKATLRIDASNLVVSPGFHLREPVVERVAMTPRPNDHNLAYLQTKRDRMGHHLPGLEGTNP